MKRVYFVFNTLDLDVHTSDHSHLLKADVVRNGAEVVGRSELVGMGKEKGRV